MFPLITLQQHNTEVSHTASHAEMPQGLIVDVEWSVHTTVDAEHVKSV